MGRTAITIPGFSHKNPIPTGCMKGNLVVTGAIGGTDPETGVMPPDLDAQCRNVFHHLDAVMRAAGGSVDDIVKIEIWLADGDNRAPVNREWLAMFPDADTRPARHITTGAAGYPANALVVGSLMGMLGG